MRLTIEAVARIADVPAAQWDALDPTGHPFTRHAFLALLEATGCVGGDSGWAPTHLVAKDERGAVVAAVPLYLKAHSWGEFIFDWSWARAYAQAGHDYYPKLLSAVPFTPVTGPRLLVTPALTDSEAMAVREQLAALLRELSQSNGSSGVHVNFTGEHDQVALEAAGFLRRHDCRFLWRNRGYASFADFLARFRAEKRKKTQRERRKVADAGIAMRTLAGESIEPATWREVFGFSERTFLRHGNQHYLNVEFFERVSRALPGTVVVKLAERGGVALGASIFFAGGGGLYGRYWGCAEPADSLHFEACYYQGVEHCIAHGLAFFDPGTQGEHKIARGFEPTRTLSAHWLEHPAFRTAVERYLERERSAVDEYVEVARTHLPFRRDEASA